MKEWLFEFSLRFLRATFLLLQYSLICRSWVLFPKRIFHQLFSPQRLLHISASVEEEMKAHESVFGLRFCHGTDVIALWNQVQVPFSGVEWHSVALLVKPHLLKFHLFLLLLLQLLEPKINFLRVRVNFLRVRVNFLRVNYDTFSVLCDLSLCINDPFLFPSAHQMPSVTTRWV